MPNFIAKNLSHNLMQMTSPKETLDYSPNPKDMSEGKDIFPKIWTIQFF